MVNEPEIGAASEEPGARVRLHQRELCVSQAISPLARPLTERDCVKWVVYASSLRMVPRPPESDECHVHHARLSTSRMTDSHRTQSVSSLGAEYTQHRGHFAIEDGKIRSATFASESLATPEGSQ